MRIAYVSLHWPRTKESGVGKKIAQQMAIWEAQGHAVRLFMHTSRYEPHSDLLPAQVIPYRCSSKVATELARMRAAQVLVEAVRAYQPDVIYLRYGMYVFPVHHLGRVASMVEEVNTNDVSQHRELGVVYDLYNRLSRGVLFRRAAGLVCVSRELSLLPAFSKYGKPVRTISNGIDLEKITPLAAPRNRQPRLAFIATPGYYWHGEDKLVLLAQQFPDLTIDLIASDHIPGFSSLPENLILHGYLETAAYRKVLAGADAAIGTLALHRKDMQEACPLKTRECLAYGLPMVLPYVDTDLDDLQCDFLLKIPNTEDNIRSHGQAIHEFAYRARGRRAERDIIFPRLDAHPKELERLRFFAELRGSTSPRPRDTMTSLS